MFPGLDTSSVYVALFMWTLLGALLLLSVFGDDT